MNYYERKEQESGNIQRICWYSIVGVSVIVILLLLANLFSGCKTIKVENTETKDSVRTEYIEKVIIDTVTVTIEVPAEKQERETNDTTSFLETSFAKSTASMKWRDGIPWLFHSLENKPQKIEKPAQVQSKEKYKIIYRTRCTTKYQYKERELNWWQKLRMYLGDMMLLFVIAAIIYGIWRIKKRLL